MMMNCDYWTLMAQPVRFLDLYKIYNSVKLKIEQEEYKKQNKMIQRGKIARGR